MVPKSRDPNKTRMKILLNGLIDRDRKEGEEVGGEEPVGTLLVRRPVSIDQTEGK